jgi:hypothetical protein
MKAWHNIPQARSVEIRWCDDPEGNCQRPHIVLFNDDDEPFAQFVLPDPRPDGGSFLKDLQTAAYHSAVLRDGGKE